jgi:hypothetical protein
LKQISNFRTSGSSPIRCADPAYDLIPLKLHLEFSAPDAFGCEVDPAITLSTGLQSLSYERIGRCVLGIGERRISPEPGVLQLNDQPGVRREAGLFPEAFSNTYPSRRNRESGIARQGLCHGVRQRQAPLAKKRGREHQGDAKSPKKNAFSPRESNQKWNINAPEGTKKWRGS